MLNLLKKTRERAYYFFKWKSSKWGEISKYFVQISSLSGCLQIGNVFIDGQGPGPSSRAWCNLYLWLCLIMRNAYLHVHARTISLLSCPFIAWSRGGRKRGQGVHPTVTRAERRKRQLGVLLGHLPICWVILVLSGERQHFRQWAWVGAADSASWQACPCGLRLLCRGGSGLPLSEEITYCLPAPSLLLTNPTCLLKLTLVLC